MASPQRRSRDQMSAETTTRLLAAARRTFAQQGYAASAMDAICAEAGVTRGALYHHFGGKEGLLLEVVHQLDAEISARVTAEEARHDDPWQGFRACCRLWLEQARDPEIQRIYLRDAPAVLGQKMRDMDEVKTIGEIRDTLTVLMDSGHIRRCDPEALARLINGALVDAALWVAANADESTLTKAVTATDLLLDGLQA